MKKGGRNFRWYNNNLEKDIDELSNPVIKQKIE